MGRSGYPTKRGNWGGGGSPCKSKSLNFPLLLDKNITYWEIPHIGTKKVFLIAFRQVLTKIFPVAFIQLHNYDLFEKARLKLSPLILNNVQQDYIPESYTRYLLSFQKCQKYVAPTRCRLSPLSMNLYGKPQGRGKSYPIAKILLISRITKIPLDRFKSFAIKISFFPHQIAIFK